MTGIPGVGTAPQIRDDILATLQRNDIVLLIDDAHHVRSQGHAHHPRHLEPHPRRRGTGTPIVLVRQRPQRHLEQTVSELFSRSGSSLPRHPARRASHSSTPFSPWNPHRWHRPDRHQEHRHAPLQWRTPSLEPVLRPLVLSATTTDPHPLTDEEAGKSSPSCPAGQPVNTHASHSVPPYSRDGDRSPPESPSPSSVARNPRPRHRRVLPQPEQRRNGRSRHRRPRSARQVRRRDRQAPPRHRLRDLVPALAHRAPHPPPHRRSPANAPHRLTCSHSST